MSARVAELAAVSALALLLTALIAAPVLRAPSERIFGMEIVGRHHDPFTVMEQFDRPVAFGVYLQPLTDIPGKIIARVSGPVAAYNWLVLLTFPLSAAAAYLLGRHLGLSQVSASIAAVAYAFAPFHLAHAAYHPHIAQTQWVPLYFLALWRCLDDSTPARFALLAISVAAVTLSNFYGGFIAAVLTPVAVATYWYFKSRAEPRPLRRLAITIGSLVIIACVGGVYAWNAAHAMIVDRSAFAFEPGDLFRYSANWWSYFVPPVEHPAFGGIAKRIWTAGGVSKGLLEQQVSLGWGIVSLGVIALVAWRRRDPQSLQSLPLAAVPVLAAVAVAALLCSLSPERTAGPFTFAWPSAFIYSMMPMFRAYARFGVVVQLMAALLAAVGAEHLWRHDTRRTRMTCAGLLALAVCEYGVWPPSLWRDVLPTPAHRWVIQQADRVHALDCAPMTPDSASVQWLTGNRVSSNEYIDDCTEPNLAGKLSAAGYSHLLVRRQTTEGRRFDSQRVPEGLRIAARFENAEVFAVTAPAPAVYTARMTAFDSREFDDTWTWRWMGGEAAWTIVNRTNHGIVATADVEMSAFDRARGLTLLLDDRKMQALIVGEGRRMNRIGPLVLSPGAHELVFRASEAPTVADDVMKNGDRRALSFALGTWRWTVQQEQP
jgi:hypothetical protein